MDQEEIDKPYIERRVAEWANRIDALYSIVQDALSGMREISTSMSRSISMNEELMQKYSVPGRELPILDIKKNGQIIATLKPIGPWVIGANGRVIFYRRKGHTSWWTMQSMAPPLIGKYLHHQIEQNPKALTPTSLEGR